MKPVVYDDELVFDCVTFVPGEERIIEASPQKGTFRADNLLAPADVSADLLLLGVTVCGTEQFAPLVGGISLFVFAGNPAFSTVKWDSCPQGQTIALRLRNTSKQVVVLDKLKVVGQGFKVNANG